MNHRFLVSVSGLIVLIAIVLMATIPVAGQATSAKAYTPTRTPDGQPDLQGFWTNTTYTPLERPKNVTKEFYTREEALELIKQAADVENDQTEPGTILDVHYDFTQFGLDRSQGGMALNLRTSMIVDPADGKIPPLSAEGQKRAAERAETRKRMGAITDAVQNQPNSVRCIITADGLIRHSSKTRAKISPPVFRCLWCGLTRTPLRIQISSVWQICTSGYCSKNATWCASLSGCHRSSESRNAINSPRARATPTFRAAETPRFD